MNPIPGCDGYYATAQGEIVSYRSGEARLIKPRLDHGYLVVTLKTGTSKSPRRKHPVHRLVNQAYHGLKPFDGAETRHINGNATDNRPDNLAWGTRSQNANDAVRHGTAVGLRKGDQHYRTKLMFNDIQLIRSSEEPLEDLATRYDVTPIWIDRIKRGRVRVAA